MTLKNRIGNNYDAIDKLHHCVLVYLILLGNAIENLGDPPVLKLIRRFSLLPQKQYSA